MAAPKGNKNAVGNKGGRPTVYNARFVTAAQQIAALGGSEFQIAEALDVELKTIWAWRYKYPEFDEACEATEEQKLAAMKRSLFHRGMGYSHKSVKIMTVACGGGTSEIVEVPYVEHYPPDVAAMKLYLVSKSKGEFTDRQEVEQSGAVTVKVVGGLPAEEENET